MYLYIYIFNYIYIFTFMTYWKFLNHETLPWLHRVSTTSVASLIGTVDGQNPANHQGWWLSQCFCRVLIIPGGAWFWKSINSMYKLLVICGKFVLPFLFTFHQVSIGVLSHRHGQQHAVVFSGYSSWGEPRKIHGWLDYIGDCTTQLYRDYNTPL